MPKRKCIASHHFHSRLFEQIIDLFTLHLNMKIALVLRSFPIFKQPTQKI
jgi:hypothetical protein